MKEQPKAFPSETMQHYGMTLRDYFSAKAMQGMWANKEFTEATYDTTAELAYTMADAMLKAREQEDENAKNIQI